MSFHHGAVRRAEQIGESERECRQSDGSPLSERLYRGGFGRRMLHSYVRDPEEKPEDPHNARVQRGEPRRRQPPSEKNPQFEY